MKATHIYAPNAKDLEGQMVLFYDDNSKMINRDPFNFDWRQQCKRKNKDKHRI